jgi:ribosomal protein S8
MNHSFLQVLNNIIIAFRAKKFKLTVRYSKQNLKFLQYLLQQGFIGCFVKKKKVLIITLRYELSLIPALSSGSICSKKGHQRTSKLLKNSQKNLTINLVENSKSYTGLLARFR